MEFTFSTCFIYLIFFVIMDSKREFLFDKQKRQCYD